MAALWIRRCHLFVFCSGYIRKIVASDLRKGSYSMGFRQLTGHEQAHFEKRLDAVLENPDIATAVLATSDGLQLAAPSISHGIDTMHVADACAKIAAVGRQVAGLSAASPRGISVCDLAGSPLVVVPLGPALLAVLGRQGTNMGMVASTARDTARRLVDGLKSVIEAKVPSAEPQPKETQQVVDEAQKADEEYQGFVFDADGFLARVLGDLESKGKPDQLGNEA